MTKLLLSRKMGPRQRKFRKALVRTMKADSFKTYKTDAKTFSSIMPVPRGFPQLRAEFRMHQTIVQISAITTTIATPTFASYGFSFSQVDQVAPLQAVFDEYCIKAIEIWLTPQFSSGVSYVNCGEISSVIDYNDINALGSVGSAYDYETCLTTNGQLGHYRCFKPAVAQALYGGALFTSFGARQDQWINTASAGVPHYGIKIAGTPTSTAFSYDLRARFSLSFRNVR